MHVSLRFYVDFDIMQFLITLIALIKLEPLYVNSTKPHEHKGPAHEQWHLHMADGTFISFITVLRPVSSAPALQTIHTPRAIFIETRKSHYTPRHDSWVSLSLTCKSWSIFVCGVSLWSKNIERFMMRDASLLKSHFSRKRQSAGQMLIPQKWKQIFSIYIDCSLDILRFVPHTA